MSALTLRQAMLEVVDIGRSLLGPAVLDFRPTLVTILTRSWPSGVRGEGPASDAALALPNYTKARHVTQAEIAGSGGLYEQGDVVIGAITPQYVSSFGQTLGFTEAQLAPVITDTQSTEVIYRLSQQAGATGINGDYARVQLRRDKSLRFELVVGRERGTPGP